MINIPLEPFYVWALIFTRVGLALAFFPLLGEMYIPIVVRVLFSAAVAAAMAPVAHFGPEAMPGSALGFGMLILSEAFIGAALGMIGRTMFAVIQFSGQIAGEQIGFGMINALDPAEQNEVSVVAELQYLGSILLFFVLNMHHVLFRALARSYELMGPGGATPRPEASMFIAQLGTMLYKLGLQFAMPVLVLIFAIHVGLGMINKAVPQINVLFEGFPVKIFAGVSLMIMSMGFLMLQWQNMFDDMEGLMERVMRLMA